MKIKSTYISAAIGLLIGLIIGALGWAFGTPVLAIAVVSSMATGFVVAKILPVLRIGEQMANFTMRMFTGGLTQPPGHPPRVMIQTTPMKTRVIVHKHPHKHVPKHIPKPEGPKEPKSKIKGKKHKIDIK